MKVGSKEYFEYAGNIMAVDILSQSLPKLREDDVAQLTDKIWQLYLEKDHSNQEEIKKSMAELLTPH